MTDIAMCRVCLTTNVRMHVLIDTPLQEIFEKLTNITLTLEDGKPLLACFICHYQLKKCHKLMSKATKTNEVLTQLLLGGVMISQIVVTGADNKAYSYDEGLCISPTENITAIESEDTSIENSTQADPHISQQLDSFFLKTPVKVEERGSEEKIEEEDSHISNNNTDVDGNNRSESDSEDDLPLKSISVKKRLKRGTKRCARVRKKERPERNKERGFIADFAREIILTKEEQFQDLLERSKSLNYLNSPLKCELCYKGFIDARAYDNHKEKHDERSGAHECGVCRMRYRSARQLRTHAASAHARRYACLRCKHRSHTAHQAREHEKWHSGHTYECKLCGQKFRKPTSYLTHMRKRHPTPHVCHMCGDSFVGRHGLLMHKSKAHQREQLSDNCGEPASERFCGECNIQFANVDAWKRHILSSVKHTLANENSAQCRICGGRFQTSTGLREHLREHARALRATRAPPARPARPPAAAHLPCEQCGANFVNRSKLQAHVKRIHMGLKYNKNIVCEVCGKKCTSNAALRYHQRTHTGERPYSCGACHKRFADNNQLRIHTRTHTGERPYCCAACGKRFSQKPALNRHYRVHTGAKPYICQYCSKTFSQSNSLKLHVRAVHLKIPPNKRNKTQIVTTDNAAIEKNAEESVTLQTL